MIKKYLIHAAIPLAVGALSASCGSVKDAVEAASGVAQLETAEQDELLAAAGWDKEKLAKFRVHGGLKLTENFPGDLGAQVDIPLPIDLPAPPGAEGKNRSLILLKTNQFKMGDQDFTRFEIVTVARIDTEAKALKIDGSVFTQYLDESQIISKANNNQAGSYLMVEGEGDGGLTYLEGNTTLQKNDGSAKVDVNETIVFTNSSPFLSRTGSTGKFFLAAPNDTKATVMAYRKGIASDFSAEGTPESASEELIATGLLDKYKGDFNEKVEGTGVDSGKANEAFDKVNTVVTDFFDAWTIIQTPLVFVQPPKAVTPPAPAETQKPETPTTEKRADPAPPAEADVVRRAPAEPADTNADLGCSGFLSDGTTSSLVLDGAKLDDANTKGWRGRGDVRITAEDHALIFGTPAEVGGTDNSKNYLDELTGYCALTTGDNLYQKSGADASAAGLQPVDGKLSEMWQKVKVPADVKTLQVRVAFMSQEFPRWVGTGFNDSFFIKFDESPGFIAQGNLNELAGLGETGTDAEKTQAENCKSNKTFGGTQTSCGQWQSVNGAPATTLNHGTLWDVTSSTQAVSHGDAARFGCSKEGESSTKCYHGWVPPRVICYDLDPDTEVGKELTLRMSISDAGDTFYDSAIAVDTIVFSKKDCNSRFTGEEPSRAITR